MNKTIILSITAVAVLSLTGCGNKSNNEEGAKNAVEKAVETNKDPSGNLIEQAKDTANKATEKAKETANKAAEATKEAAGAVADKAKEGAEKAVEATKEVAKKTTEAVKEGANKAAEATKEAASAAADKAKEAVSGGNAKGKAVFAKCVSCHGADGKTKALGKSEVIAGQAAADLEKKIAEYKAGSRNVAGMGQLMNGQVKGLSDEDIKAVAEYISSLK